MLKVMQVRYNPVDVKIMDNVEFGSREEVGSIVKGIPYGYYEYMGMGVVRDRENHRNIKVHVFMIPWGNKNRLFAYPAANQ